jgi:hypothetical protein
VGSRNFALRRTHRYADGKIPAIPLRAFDNLAYWGTLLDLHRLQSCSPNSKGKAMSDTNKPAATITFFPITASIWRDESGEKVYYRTTISKFYKNAEGYSTTNTFGQNDLLLVAKVADLAHSEIFKLRANDRNYAQQNEEAA